MVAMIDSDIHAHMAEVVVHSQGLRLRRTPTELSAGRSQCLRLPKRYGMGCSGTHLSFMHCLERQQVGKPAHPVHALGIDPHACYTQQFGSALIVEPPPHRVLYWLPCTR